MWEPIEKTYKTRLGLAARSVADFLHYCFDKNYLDSKRRLHHLPFLPVVLLDLVGAEKRQDGSYVLD